MSFADEIQEALRVFLETVRAAAEREALAMVRKQLAVPMTMDDFLRFATEPPEVDAHRAPSEALARLVEYVRVHPGQSDHEIAAGTGIKVRTAQRYLRELRTDGRIQRIALARLFGGRTFCYYPNEIADQRPHDAACDDSTKEPAYEALPVDESLPSSDDKVETDDTSTIAQWPQVSAEKAVRPLAGGSPEP